jgi:hypothetical protein
MSNPFTSKYDGACQGCGDRVLKDDYMFGHEGLFICMQCAEDEEIVCPDCSEYKKPEFDKCYNCFKKKK